MKVVKINLNEELTVKDLMNLDMIYTVEGLLTVEMIKFVSRDEV